MKIRINQLEQKMKKNCIVISGVKETFAERTDNGAFANNPPLTTREDTVSTARLLCYSRNLQINCDFFRR